MSRVVYLHVGAPKTGTTYLQDRLTLNAANLARHGVHLPTTGRFVDPALSHFRAALDLLGQDWGGSPGHAEGAWDSLVRQVRRRRGTVIVSHEILAPAPVEAAAKAVRDLSAGGTEVHVVYSARDLARQLPAAWQESIKQGRRWRYRRFERRAMTGRIWFARAFDLPGVLETWGAGLPADRVHVVTVPQRRAAPAGPGRPDALWLRFCQVFGVDPAWAPEDSEQVNASLGVLETEVLRQLNRRIDRGKRDDPVYDKLVREVLAQRELVRRGSEPVRMNPARFDWAQQQAERWIGWIREHGVQVAGELDDLRPQPEPQESWQNPDRLPARRVLRVAYRALEAMTREAAARPDQDYRLAHVVRQGVQRVRNP